MVDYHSDYIHELSIGLLNEEIYELSFFKSSTNCCCRVKFTLKTSSYQSEVKTGKIFNNCIVFKPRALGRSCIGPLYFVAHHSKV